MKSSSTNKTFFFLFVFTIGLLYKFYIWNQNPVLSRDSCLYVHLVEIWTDQGDFQKVVDAWESFWIPPLPLYIMKTIMKYGVSGKAAGLGLNFFFGSFIPIVMYCIAKEFSHKNLFSIMATFFAIVNPVLNELAVQIQRDILYLFFVGIILYYMILLVKHANYKHVLLLGTLCALGSMTRFETFELFLFTFIILCSLIAFRKINFSHFSLYTALFIASYIGVIFIFSNISGTNHIVLDVYPRYILQHWNSVILSISA